MSGPWEDYQQPEEVAPPAAPSIATPTAEAGPWEDFAGATEAGGDEGITAPPAVPETPEGVRAELERLVNQRVPRAAIDRFLQDTRMVLEPETQEYFDQYYEDWRNTEDGPGKWRVNPIENREEVGDLEAAWAGMQSGALRGFDDEWKALTGAVGNKLGTALGMNESTAGFWDIYESLQEGYEQDKNEAYEQNTLAYGLGFAPGMLFGPSLGAVTQGASGADKVRRLAAVGGAEGAVSGAGNADDGLLNRAGGAAVGGTIGAVTAPLVAPVAEKAVNIGGKLLQRVGARENSLNSGLDVLARAAPQDADLMAARAAEMEAANVPARLVDVVDESGKGVIGSAARRMTPARDELAEHANEVYTGAQDRVADQARRNISSAPNTARQITQSIEAERTNLGPRFDAVRAAPVELTPELIEVFGSVQGRTALGRVARYMTADEQQALRRFSSAVRQAATLDPALPEGVRRQIMSQLMEGNPLTVDVADKFARVVRTLGRDDGMMRAATDMANAVRGAARTQHPEYDAALIDFERLSGVADAAGGTGAYAADDFMKAAPDQYAVVRDNAGDAPITVEGPDGPVTYPSERTVAEVRARDEVVDKATSGRGAGAMGVARQLSEGSAQRQRNRTLLGEEGAESLERAMAAEVRRVDNTRSVDPRAGSATAGRLSDDQEANDAMNFVADAATPGFWGPVRAVARWFRSQGIRGVDAERLVRDAISEDPDRVSEAIEYLTRRGLSRERSRSLVRAVTAQMAGRSAGALSGDRVPRKPARSVRAVLQEAGRE